MFSGPKTELASKELARFDCLRGEIIREPNLQSDRWVREGREHIIAQTVHCLSARINSAIIFQT